MQHMNTFQAVTRKPITDKIATIVADVNTLLGEVSNDYEIDAKTGALHGRRMIPSLTGEVLMESAIIGFIAVGECGLQTGLSYFADHGPVRASGVSREICFTSKAERAANLDDRHAVVNHYESIHVVSSFPDIIVGAFVVVLEQHGFICTVAQKPLADTPAQYRSSLMAPAGMFDTPVELRIARSEFVDYWKGMLGLPPYGQPYQSLAIDPTPNPDQQ